MEEQKSGVEKIDFRPITKIYRHQYKIICSKLLTMGNQTYIITISIVKKIVNHMGGFFMHISKEKVRLHMKKHGITTQKELAEQLGVSKSQLSMLLSSNYNPIKSNAMKLCETLDVNINDITRQLEFDLGIDETPKKLK